MKRFANENLFDPIFDHLRSIGHDVLSLREAGLSGISDDEVYQLACKEKQVIITMDKDFTRMFRFPPKSCGGIIVVKLYRRTIDETLSLFKKLLRRLKKKISKIILLLSLLREFARGEQKINPLY